jgi:hypothetical protein
MEEDKKPVMENHPIDETLQTGESRRLGGAMSIHAPYKQD